MKLFRFLTFTVLATALGQVVHAQPSMTVNGAAYDYLTLHYYVNEPGESESVYVELTPNTANVELAQVWENVGRRDYATLGEQDAASIPGPSPASTNYFVGFPMTNAGAGKWAANIPINKTGAYRLTGRFKVTGNANWTWVGGRDTAIVVSPKKSRDVILYELQINVINATGDTLGTRSTFEDLMNTNKPANLDYFQSLGVNTLWIQPIHPIGVHPCVTNVPGSPYSIQNMWEVAPHHSQGNTRQSSMAAFTNFAAAAKSKGIDFFFDIIFNHTSWDAEIGRDPNNPSQPATNAAALIKNILPQWYSRYNSASLPCDEYSYTQSNFAFDQPATSASQIGPAPAERNDFGKWPDVADLFWGSYPALFDPQTASDTYWTYNQVGADVRHMVDYFAYFGTFWIEKSGGTLSGFRCDYAQGLPPQAWEYFVNKIRQTKWDFIFMAESLDGGNVSKRAGRHMDIINQNWVWQMLDKGGNTTGLRGIIDTNKADYGYAGIMRGLINHDQNAPDDVWYSFSRYAVGAVIDGAPQMYQGQELGYRNNYGFSQFRNQFSRWIPNILRWHNMQTLWNTRIGILEQAYRRVNHGRMLNGATRLHGQWYLNQTGGGAVHQQIFSVLKYETFGADPANQNVVLNFVNLTPWTQQSGTFALSGVGAITLNPTNYYNVRNLTANDPDAHLWAAPGRTGQDILNNGVQIIMPADGNANPDRAFVQMLVLEAQGATTSSSIASWLPAIPSNCPTGTLTVTYAPNQGVLSNASPIRILIGHNGFQGVTTNTMADIGSGQWQYTFAIPGIATQVDFSFGNMAGTVLDTKGGTNWHVAVATCPPLTGFLITNPAASLVTVSNATTSIDLQGVADNVIGHMLWTNNLSGGSGLIPVLSPWSITGISLAQGTNVIVVRGTNQSSSTVTNALDAAASYSSANWTNGSNMGTGFGSWSLFTNVNAGRFIATTQGNATLKIAPSAFGLWAQSGSLSEAARTFTSPMTTGQVFRCTLQNYWILEGQQSVGVALRNAGGASLIQFFFNGGDTSYSIQDAGAKRSSGLGWTNVPQTVEVELLSATSYVMRVGSTILNGAYTGTVSNARFWNWSGGVGSNYDFFFNYLVMTTPGSGAGVSTSATITVVRMAAAGGGDTNNDGIPDSWYMQYGMDYTQPGLASDDSDDDHVINWDEYVSGTDPTNSLSYLRVDHMGPDGGVNHLSWPSVSNRLYDLHRSHDLGIDGGGFYILATNIVSEPPTNAYDDTSAGEHEINVYRISVEMAP